MLNIFHYSDFDSTVLENLNLLFGVTDFISLSVYENYCVFRLYDNTLSSEPQIIHKIYNDEFEHVYTAFDLHSVFEYMWG